MDRSLFKLRLAGCSLAPHECHKYVFLGLWWTDCIQWLPHTAMATTAKTVVSKMNIWLQTITHFTEKTLVSKMNICLQTITHFTDFCVSGLVGQHKQCSQQWLSQQWLSHQWLSQQWLSQQWLSQQWLSQHWLSPHTNGSHSNGSHLVAMALTGSHSHGSHSNGSHNNDYHINGSHNNDSATSVVLALCNSHTSSLSVSVSCLAVVPSFGSVQQPHKQSLCKCELFGSCPQKCTSACNV